MSTKYRYAASANYINTMSDYCKHCVYNPRIRVTSTQENRTSENACPFNFFYWDFLARHHKKLKHQGRMTIILRHLERISPEELQTIRQQAADWHASQVRAEHSLPSTQTYGQVEPTAP